MKKILLLFALLTNTVQANVWSYLKDHPYLIATTAVCSSMLIAGNYAKFKLQQQSKIKKSVKDQEILTNVARAVPNPANKDSDCTKIFLQCYQKEPMRFQIPGMKEIEEVEKKYIESYKQISDKQQRSIEKLFVTSDHKAELRSKIRQYNEAVEQFNKSEKPLNLVKNEATVLHEKIEQIAQKINNRLKYYNFACGIEKIGRFGLVCSACIGLYTFLFSRQDLYENTYITFDTYRTPASH